MLIQASLSLSLIVIEGMQFTNKQLLNEIVPEETDDAHLKPSPESTSSIFSFLTFSWMDSIISLGNIRSLVMSDLWDLSDCDKSEVVVEKYRKLRTQTVFLKDRPLLQLLTVTRISLLIQYASSFLCGILAVSSAFWLNLVLRWMQCRDEPVSYAIFYLFGMFAFSTLFAILEGLQNFYARRVGMQLRSILVAELFRKSLRRVSGTLPSTSQDNAEGVKSTSENNQNDDPGLGNILQLMSNDTEKIRELAASSHEGLLRIPVTIIVSFGALIYLLGPSAIIGVSVIILSAPISTWAGKYYNKHNEKLMAAADKRIHLTNEVLQGIKIIKYFAWEPKFKLRIERLRNIELQQLVKIFISRMIFINASYSSGTIAAVVSLSAYTMLFGKNLDAATAFTALKLLHETVENLGFLPDQIVNLLQGRMSFNRIMRFLKTQEIERYTSANAEVTANETSNLSVGFSDAAFTYYTEEDEETQSAATKQVPTFAKTNFTLRNLNIVFPHKNLSLVTGAIGSGKSSMLLALLGELKRTNGISNLPDVRLSAHIPPEFKIQGVAYVAQSAWMLNTSIRENILFGLPFDEKRYFTVLERCALTKDLQTFEGGDLTEIGEKGINLSGGQ
ncbi:hypothetical protein HK096_004773, partial [Nowakowskiella sp. JEL0078]